MGENVTSYLKIATVQEKAMCVKEIVCNTPVTSLDELKLRIVVAIETVTPQMLENIWRKIEYLLDILHATKG
jgi:hypothetical protein